MKNRVWPFGFSEQIDEQSKFISDISDRLFIDTNGLFRGEVRRKFDEISLWICNSSYPEYFVKFFKISQNEGDIYPCSIKHCVNDYTKTVNSFEELKTIFLEMVESEDTQKSLSKFLLIKHYNTF